MAARIRLLALLALAALACALPATASAKTIWLCKPGIKRDACTPGLKTTRFSPAGKRLGVDAVKRPRHPKFDCFYVYPTVSDQKHDVATRAKDPEVRSIALFQAARYSSVCRVFAPMYRQRTLQGILKPSGGLVGKEAYADVKAAWLDYLRRYNHGRGVVFIGHSQGSFVLRKLLAEQVDRKPKVRRRLVSAVLLGGNVLVKKGSDRGGDFKNIRACRTHTQIGCVIAFSTFNRTPPGDAIFGHTAAENREVLCTNPAALGGGSARVTPIYPTKPYAPGTTIAAAIAGTGSNLPSAKTPWISVPGSYTARCSSEGGANVLRITARGGAPTLNPVPNEQWGTHLADANIALGQLTNLVRDQARAFLARR